MKAFLVIFMLLTGWLSSIAVNPYYYSMGERIPLTKVNDRMSVAVPLSTVISLPYDCSVVREFKDDHFRIIVCENKVRKRSGSDSDSFKAKLQAVSPLAIVSPCYKTTAGDNVAVSPYLNVELKQAADSTLLETAARVNNLTIISQGKFLPLWYILSVTPETNCTSLEIANWLYETGLFGESIADFLDI